MLPDTFYQFKNIINSLLPLSADALHVHVGLGLFIAVLILADGKPKRFAIAFGVVLASCLAGELLDILYDLREGNPVRWRNGIKDTVNTILWPTIWAIVGTQFNQRKIREDPLGVAESGPPPILSSQPK